MKWLGDAASAYKLRSGRTFSAHGGVLGMDDQASGVSEGWDGAPDPSPPFTARERWEIAEYMVTRWRKWARRTR